MPDGGSDCCMTCWFNSTHEGKIGYLPDPHKDPVRCVIRDFDVESISWTYCANHPHHNSKPIRLPIGPVLTCGSFPYHRTVLLPSPDSEGIRLMLLGLIETMPERYEEGYGSGDTVGDAAVKQLGEFREPRAVPALRRILMFDPLTLAEGARPTSSADRTRTVGLAAEALAAILGDEALPELLPRTQAGRAEADAMSNYDQFKDPLRNVRAFAVRGLRHVSPATRCLPPFPTRIRGSNRWPKNCWRANPSRSKPAAGGWSRRFGGRRRVEVVNALVESGCASSARGGEDQGKTVGRGAGELEAIRVDTPERL